MRKFKGLSMLTIICISFFILGTIKTSAAKKVVTVTHSYSSSAGIKVAKHYSTTTFSYNGTSLLSPKTVDTDYWTAPLNGVRGTSNKWDWYNSKSGRSNSLVKFYFGIPTPWGSIGSDYSSRIYTNVFSNGSFKY